MFCPECGEENVDEANFCQNCGKKLPNQEPINEDSESNIFEVPKDSVEDFKSDLDLLQKVTPELINYIDNYDINSSEDALDNLKADLEEKKAKIGAQLKVIDIDILKIDYAQDNPQNIRVIINADEEKLQKYVDYYKQKSIEVPSDLWTDKCPVCKNGKLFFHNQKGLLGLKTDHLYECENCGAIFKQKGEKYQLKSVTDQLNPIWNEYGKLDLTEREWSNIANGGMSDQKQEDDDINAWLTDARNGLVKYADESSPVILKKNEKSILVLNGISFYEPRAVRNTRGNYGGASFRVAKGVTLRTGSFSSKSVSHDELKKVDDGMLTLTNKRLIFTGNKRTTNIDLRKIVAIEPFKEGIASQRENKQKTEHFLGINKTSLNITANGRKYTLPVDGIVLKCMIEGLIMDIS